MKPVIIVTTPRTGSTVICEILGNLLMQHNGCKNVLYEYFDVSTAFKCEFAVINGVMSITDYIRFGNSYKWCNSQKEYISDQIFRLTGEYNYLIKYMLSESDQEASKLIEQFITEHYDIVYLERRDKIKQLLSYLVLTQTKIAHYANQASKFYGKNAAYNQKIVFNHLETELFIKYHKKYQTFKNAHPTKYPIIYYEDFIALGSNDSALINILKLPIDTYTPTSVSTIPTPYIANNLEDQILNKVDWGNNLERISNELL